MRYRRIGTFFIITLITAALLSAAVYFDEASAFDRISVSEEKYNRILSERKRNSGIGPDKLFFNENPLFYDSSTRTWYYSIVDGERQAYNPKIRFSASDGASSSLKIIIKDSRITKESIASNTKIRFAVYDDKCFSEYYLICTTLPVISLEYDSSQSIEADTETEIRFTLFDNRCNISEDRFIVSKAYAHTRGATSSVYPKHSYKLNMRKDVVGDGGVITEDDNNLELLGMRRDDDWILYSIYSDPEKVRNVFASNLWFRTCAGNNGVGVFNGNEYKYAELFINGKYSGLYALGYMPDKKTLGLSKDENGVYSEYLFKKNNDFQSEGLAAEMYLDDFWGYVLKTDLNDGGAVPALNRFFYTLQNTEEPELIYNLIDIDNVMDFFLYVNLVCGVDNVHGGAMKNVLLSFHRNEDSLKVIYTPWDLDLTFGNAWDPDAKNNILDYCFSPDTMLSMYLNPLDILRDLGDTDISSKVYDRYFAHRQTGWSDEVLNSMIDEYENIIYGSGAYYRDMRAWCEGSYTDPEKGLDDFREWVNEHVKYLDRFIEKKYGPETDN